ncbi:MAG: RHS repeat-associated core domain-containing protein [Chloroflexota bacterium]
MISITQVAAVTYTFDNNGNLTNCGGLGAGGETYAYDRANRLISATIGTTAATTYAYDPDGKRISATVSGQVTNYLYDVNRGLPVLLEDGTRRYVWGQGLAYAVSGSGATLEVDVYHPDGLGSIRAQTDSSGAIVQTYQTDEFGNPTLSDGTRSQPFGFTGEQRDASTGLIYLRARMYDPSIGRFMQRDPLCGSITRPQTRNRFGYALGNPISVTDPSGNCGVSEELLNALMADCMLGCALGSLEKHPQKNAIAGGMVATGLPLVPTRGKLSGATPGTSVASVVWRRLLPYEWRGLRSVPAPTMRNAAARTASVGAFVARWQPILGGALLAIDYFSWLNCVAECTEATSPCRGQPLSGELRDPE